jgi:hypothetical protein
MTEEFDIMEAFQRIRQQLHDTRQPRNIGSIAEALQAPSLVHDNFNFTVSPWSTDWRLADGSWIGRDEIYETIDELEDEDDDDDELINIMDCMAWAYMPEEIQREIRSRFYNGVPAIHQIVLTIPDENQINNISITGATVEIRRDNHSVHLLLGNEVIAWYTSTSPVVDDKYHPIFFVYDYGKLGRFFLGAAQVLWNALGYPVCIESERYIWDDETTPWETADDAELRDYVHNRIKQFGQLSGNSGWLKPKIRNARRRRNLL